MPDYINAWGTGDTFKNFNYGYNGAPASSLNIPNNTYNVNYQNQYLQNQFKPLNWLNNNSISDVNPSVDNIYNPLGWDSVKKNMDIYDPKPPSEEQKYQNIAQNALDAYYKKKAERDKLKETETNPTQTENSFNWKNAFEAAGKVGEQIGGTAGATLQGASQVGSSVINMTDAAKKAGGWSKLTGLEKSSGIAGIAGSAANIAGSFLPQKTEYSGAKGSLTSTADSLYDGISTAAMSFGPVGSLIGGAMMGASLVGKGLNAIGGGTDGQTTTDAILGSSFFNWTPLGMVNGFGGKRADTISRNDEAFSQVGGSYSGTKNTVNDALQKSGKKYGLFSSGARRDANKEIAEATRQQNVMSDIANQSYDAFNRQGSMSAINANKRKLQLQGGWDPTSVQVGKQGMILKAQEGTILDPYETYFQSLPDYQQNTKDFRVKDYWEYNGKPKNFDEAVQKGMFSEQDDYDEQGNYIGKYYHAFSVAENPSTGEIEFMKSSSHPSIQKELDWYNSKEGEPFRNQYELVKSEPYYKYVKRKNEVKQETSQHKEGGSIIQLIDLPEEFQNGGAMNVESTIELVDIFSIPEFQNGGAMNVIPEGALHARKHNIDLEGITKKGIPVVSEEENGILQQQAEVEKEEIILRLELTQRLEQLKKKYYSDEYSNSKKDEFALKAGKLLIEEILYNTQDNAKLLQST